ncbi:hypothetical protein [Methylobacterium aquaticum]|uniref:Uncharacterized protein n=1 Tax=Methylobacterium aquaticum TaxID=270351 RepID=A0A0C6FPZ5_9HYPH|nr:hypothetical protein [Methylobacterium aquaticum]BAQ50363.1 hypothetical protein Maq22A_4p60015 [Methylobacterium aquaticum]
MTTPHPDPAHVEIVAKVIHDQTWMERADSDRFDRMPDVWKRPYRASAVKILTQIDTLAAKVAVIAGERAS